MIDISYLYCGKASGSVPHRYGRFETGDSASPFRVPPSAAERRPIVVWNVSRRCNLRCVHCYSDSEAKAYDGELMTEQARRVIEDLASFRVPAVLFSGGEPLMRADLFDLALYARECGIMTVLSTNGTLITPAVARRIRDSGFSYVGVSLDGIGEVHDTFRGVYGAFARTMSGIRSLIAAGQKTGLRLTLTKQTMKDIDRLFDLIVQEGIRRVCFYHLVPAGRGKEIYRMDPYLTRQAIERILDRSRSIIDHGYPLEVLTVDNHADGPFIYMKLKEEGDPRAADVYDRILWNGGAMYSSGIGIACIDTQGEVHPDQFWTHYSLGNVKSRKFSEIWSDPDEPLLQKLRDRRLHLKGRCRDCKFVDLCGGALRVRAEMAGGDPWGPDPGCYLSDQEIGLAVMSRGAE